ncbi:MAG: GNAT family N-acetyltransferase [Candidatus Aminicenantales bacterium]
MIRPMTEADRETVFEINRTTGMFIPEEISAAQEMIDFYLARPDQKEYFFVVAENEKKEVIGYLSYGPASFATGVFDLYWVAVVPSRQGQGYGRELIGWLEKKVQEERGRMIIIETSSQPKYQPTRQFYQRFGYEEVTRIADYYKPGDDRILYIKRFA